MRGFMACMLVPAVVALAGCGSSNHEKTASNQAPPITPTAHDSSPPAPLLSVAVIDLDDIAQRVGRMDEIRQSLQEKETELNDNLNLLTSTYENEVAEKKKELGQPPSDAQKSELAALTQRLNSNILKVRQQSQQELAFHRNSLMIRFREEVKPLAQQVANAHGMSVVITSNYVYSTAAGVNITDEVVQRWLGRRSTSDGSATKTDQAAETAAQPPAPKATTGGGEFQR